MVELSALLAVVVSLTGPVLASFFAAQVMRETKLTKADSSRSQCDHCGKDLSPIELIPVVSYVLQRGKCTHCKQKIDVRIWLAELLGLGLFSLFSYGFALKHLLTLDSLASVLVFLSLFAFLAALLYLAVYDLMTLTIPTPPLLFLLIMAAGVNIFAWLYPQVNLISIVPEWGLAGNLFAATLLGLGVWMIVKITKEKGMGMGDVYLFAILGLFGGPVFSVSMIYLTIGAALVVGLVQAGRLRKFHGVIVPLVPCIAFAFVGALVWGEAIFQLLFPIFVS